MASDGRLRRLANILALCAVCLGPAVAMAEPTAAERETARNAMQLGDQLYAAGDRRGALIRYRSAHALMHVTTTGLAVAKVEAELGLLVEARSSAIEVVNLPGEGTESVVLARARSSAAELAVSLQPRVPALVIDVAPAGLDVLVLLDGNALPRETRELPLKANPGAHTVEIQALGYFPQIREVMLEEGQISRFSVELLPTPQPIAAALPPVLSPVATLRALPARPRIASPAPAVDGGSHLTPGLVAWVVGGVVLAAGATTGIVSLVSTAHEKAHCEDERYCGLASKGELRTANTLANIANVAIPLGLVGVTFGLFEWLTRRADQPKAHSAQRLELEWVGTGAVLWGTTP
jgi:hypothetical protein